MALSSDDLSNLSGPIEPNPLQKYFRSPAIQLKLPSQGHYWSQGALDPTLTGEYPVYPMTAKDEMLFNNPDALLNGQGVVDVIKSCIPAIKDPWAIPNIDLDVILVAIRIASYGEKMEFLSTCPSCKAENNYDADLKLFIDRPIDFTVFQETKTHNNLTFAFKPQNYKTINTLNMETFNTERLVRVTQDQSLSDDEKIAKVNEIFERLNGFTVSMLKDGIASITMDDETVVTHPGFIDEFIRNTDRKTFKFIQDSITAIAEKIKTKPLPMVCPECQHNYEIPFTFDNANFFDLDS